MVIGVNGVVISGSHENTLRQSLRYVLIVKVLTGTSPEKSKAL